MMMQWLHILRVQDVIDIIVIAYLVYKLLDILKGTMAMQLLKGIFVLLIAGNVAKWLGLHTLDWLFGKVISIMFIALPVIFQPEIRQALGALGRGGIGYQRYKGASERLIGEITDALKFMRLQRIGAILVFQRRDSLGEFAAKGTTLNAELTSELLLTIFTPSTPLHDGAVIIRGDIVQAAACFLPLSDNPFIEPTLGSRHRAALGITEVSDAIAFVVSEERAEVSLAVRGRLVRDMNEDRIKKVLSSLYRASGESGWSRLWRKVKRKK